MAELGVGPQALARTRRAQTARLLLDQTDLSVTDIAFDRDVDGVLTTALAMGRAPGCPFTEDNNNRGRVALMRGWAWATYTLEDAEAWIASDESTDGIDRSGQGTGRRVDFSHEASTGTRLWFAEPNFHPSGDTFGRVMAFDLDTFGL